MAVVTAGALFFFLKPSDEKADTVQKTNVVVAVKDIPENATITAEMVKTAAVPVDWVISSSYNHMNSVVGKTASAKIMAGEQIVGSRLVEVGSSDSGALAYAVTPGMRAITIGINDTSSLKNMIKPADFIDIIAQYQVEKQVINAEGNAEVKTIPEAKLLLQKIKVLAVDRVMQKTGAEKYTTLTLEVTADQAVLLSFSENTGVLRAILRSPLDTENNNVKDVTIYDIISSQSAG